MLRSILLTLTLVLAVLLVALAVVTAGFLLAQATGDDAGAFALLWIARALIMLLGLVLTLLVGALAVRAIQQDQPSSTRAGRELGNDE